MTKTRGDRTCGSKASPTRKPSCGNLRSRQNGNDGASAQVQPFPVNGKLFNRLDLTKTELGHTIGKLGGKIRSYKMTSVSVDDGSLQQWGSGPNYQGGCLTLCTCAHKIRAEKRNPDDWLREWWFAGFTSPMCQGAFWLFYLARVGKVYKSMAELWASLPAPLRLAKSAKRNRLGDAYQPNPKSTCLDPFDANHYYPPSVGHSHRKNVLDDTWKRDVEFYDRSFKRHDVYLVAKPELTFLWQTPLLYVKSHPRNRTWETMGELLSALRTVGP
jgi:hypothetical protein